MLEVIESLAVHYFELNGFFVKRGNAVAGRTASTAHPFIIVQNERDEITEERFVFEYQWFSTDILHLNRSVITFLGVDWLNSGKHIAKTDKKLTQYFKKSISGKTALPFGWEAGDTEEWSKFKKLALLPVLPQADAARDELFAVLQKKDIDGVLTLKTLFDHLIQRLDDLDGETLPEDLKLLKVLKQLDLINQVQMDMFVSL